MKERPILFSAPMVRAILDGRKTQTRRIIKPQPHEDMPKACGWYSPTKVDRRGFEYPGDEVFGFADDTDGWVCPYGAPGDRLWVRETWFDNGSSWDGCTNKTPSRCVYRADGEFVEQFPEDHLDAKWTPSIHMPRWASRITLEITGVRVERLNAISEADAQAEGVERIELSPGPDFGSANGIPMRGHPATSDCVTAFRQLWESINGPGSWHANPWVWVVEFRRLERSA